MAWSIAQMLLLSKSVYSYIKTAIANIRELVWTAEALAKLPARARVNFSSKRKKHLALHTSVPRSQLACLFYCLPVSALEDNLCII